MLGDKKRVGAGLVIYFGEDLDRSVVDLQGVFIPHSTSPDRVHPPPTTPAPTVHFVDLFSTATRDSPIFSDRLLSGVTPKATLLRS